jgi:hypothetical protein
MPYLQDMNANATKGATAMATAKTVGYVSEWRQVEGGKLVHRYSIAGTRTIVFAAYEPARLMGTHSTITTCNGAWVGTVASRALPPELDDMHGEERYAAVDAWRQDKEAQAYALIVQAYPDAIFGQRRHGDIEIQA